MRKILILMITGSLVLSCGIDSDVLNNDDKNISINLIFPEKDSECTEGILVSDTQSELVFRWEDINENGPYVVHLTKNSKEETFESNDTELAITLDRGIAYSWYVTGTVNTTSASWDFYNAGPGLEASIPLPASAVSPVSGASISQTSTTVNLVWKSEDFDDDIIGYDLYFGEAMDSPLYETDINETRFNGIPVTAGKTYYWKVITKDSIGNESESPIFVFTVG
ncbi:hypothetical protein ACNR9Q_09960 [Maribacter sp. X9]|uniref:hypothetical protein n=1 Tax=Maribacter sp. X9 TaxID=3402159 RepID=UPI003AF3C207